jgi:hypothetical protein
MKVGDGWIKKRNSVVFTKTIILIVIIGGAVLATGNSLPDEEGVSGPTREIMQGKKLYRVGKPSTGLEWE